MNKSRQTSNNGLWLSLIVIICLKKGYIGRKFELHSNRADIIYELNVNPKQLDSANWSEILEEY